MRASTLFQGISGAVLSLFLFPGPLRSAAVQMQAMEIRPASNTACRPPPLGEVSTMKALRWLKAHQNDDGSWSKTQPLAMSGLALLCFLEHDDFRAHCPHGLGGSPYNLQDSLTTEFDPVVSKATDYLTKKIDGVGAGLAICDQGDATGYAHVIVTHALARAYSMGKKPALKPVMEKAVAIIIAGQRTDGGWACGYKQDGAWNLPFTTRQVQALKEAMFAGSEHPLLKKSLIKATEFVQTTAFQDGAFHNTPDDKKTSPLAQATGAYSLLMLGLRGSVEIKTALKWLRDNVKPVWFDEIRTKSDPTENFVPGEWYHQTWAMFLGGAEYWHEWNRLIAPQLTRNQTADGQWDFPPRKPATSSNAGIPDEISPITVTAYCCLTLEVAYGSHALQLYRARSADMPTPSPVQKQTP